MSVAWYVVLLSEQTPLILSTYGRRNKDGWRCQDPIIFQAQVRDIKDYTISLHFYFFVRVYYIQTFAVCLGLVDKGSLF